MYRKITLLLALNLVFISIFAQPLSYRKIDLTTYLGSKTLKEFNVRIYNAAITGTIKAFKTDTLTRQYTMDELKTQGCYEEVVQYCPFPDYPDYCYDTTLLSLFDSDNISGNFITESWSIDIKKALIKTNYHSFALCFMWKFAGMDLGEQPLFWLDFNELSNVLNPSELILFKQAIFKETQFFYSDSMEVSLVSHRKINLVDYLGETKVKDLNKRIYLAAIEWKFPVYKSAQLETVYSKNELKYRGGEEVIIQIAPYTDDPDYYIDSTVVQPCNYNELQYNSVSENLSFDERSFSYTSRIHAISPNALIIIKQEELFWISVKDLKHVLSKFEIEVLTHAIYRATIEQHGFYY